MLGTSSSQPRMSARLFLRALRCEPGVVAAPSSHSMSRLWGHLLGKRRHIRRRFGRTHVSAHAPTTTGGPITPPVAEPFESTALEMRSPSCRWVVARPLPPSLSRPSPAVCSIPLRATEYGRKSGSNVGVRSTGAGSGGEGKIVADLGRSSPSVNGGRGGGHLSVGDHEGYLDNNVVCVDRDGALEGGPCFLHATILKLHAAPGQPACPPSVRRKPCASIGCQPSWTRERTSGDPKRNVARRRDA
jgi:hypothetical protein